MGRPFRSSLGTRPERENTGVDLCPNKEMPTGRRQPQREAQCEFLACPRSNMLLSAFATTLVLLPFASASVHKLKLNKLPQVSPGHALETAYLAEKYGVQAPYQQLPLIGAGGAGRNIRPPTEDDDLFWTQEIINGGHNVPLTSMHCPVFTCRHIYVSQTS